MRPSTRSNLGRACTPPFLSETTNFASVSAISRYFNFTSILIIHYSVYIHTRYVLFFPPSVHLSSFCVFLVSRQNIRAFEYLWSKSKKYTIRILRVAFLQEISRMKRSFEENARHRSTRAITRSEEARNLVVTGYLRNLGRTREISVSRAILNRTRKLSSMENLKYAATGRLSAAPRKIFEKPWLGRNRLSRQGERIPFEMCR